MSPLRREIRDQVRLALPVMATQVGMMLMGVVDTIMVGHFSVASLAAASLGHTWLFATMLFGMGIVMGMDPLVSQAHGARDGPGAGRILQRGVVIALLVSIPLAGCWALTERVLLLAGQDPELAAMAGRYASVQIPSVPCFMLFTVLRQYLQGRAIVRPAMWVMGVANVLNAGFNWVLIFGKLGFPELGLYGAGIATSLTRSALLLGLTGWILLFKLHLDAWAPWSRDALRLRGLAQLLRLGFPVGIQLSLEVGAFSIAALMAGWLGRLPLAAHSVVINMASLSFMMPLGISIAVSTRVGNLIGAGAQAQLMQACRVGFLLGGGVMLLWALLFVLGREWLPTLYVEDHDVLELCAWILPIAASFQLFDGLQVVGSGILRGMGRTRAAAGVNVVGYYVVALPLGAWLAFRTDLGLAGVWWGLCLGLAVVACGVIVWVMLRASGSIKTQKVH